MWWHALCRTTSLSGHGGKDPAGARVIEAFLVSNAAAKQKHKLVKKLRGHFGELAVLSSGSFTVEKCFSISNLSLKETIVSELASFETELSKTRQGPYLLKKLDVEGFGRRPDQWRSSQSNLKTICLQRILRRIWGR